MQHKKTGIGGGLAVAVMATTLFAACPRNPTTQVPLKAQASGSVALSPDRKFVYVADQDNGGVAVVDPNAASGHVDFIKTGDRPERLIVRGNNLFVSNRFSRTVTHIDATTRKIIRQIAVGAEPMGMDVSDDGSTLYVTHATGQAVHAIDVNTGAAKWQLNVGEEVRAVAALPDGRLYVPAYKTGAMHVIDGQQGKEITTFLVVQPPVQAPYGGGSISHHPTMVEDIVASPTGAVYLPHSQANDNQLQPVTKRYYITPNNFTVSPGYTTVDFTQDKLLTEPTDGQAANFPPTMVTPNQAYAGPKVAILDGSGQYLYSVNYLSNNVALLPLNRQVTPGTTSLADSLSGISDGVQALVSVGAGPNGIALSGDQKSAFVYNSFDHSLSVIVADGAGLRKDRDIVAITEQTLTAQQQRGRLLFHDATSANITDPTTGGIACASCHPNGREDGHTWQFAEGQRNTPSLVGKHLKDTAPYHWDGAFKEFAGLQAVLQQRMGGQGISEDDFNAMLDYLANEPGPDNPNRNADGTLTAQQAQGKALFEGKAGCATCHTGEAMTDNNFHDVGTLFSTIPESQLDSGSGLYSPSDRQPFSPNTPSLLGIFATAPYLHDGTAATLDARVGDNDDSHGTVSGLTADERQALVAYLKAL